MPNPGFESYTACPNSQGQVSYATGWNISRYTAEYFNSCAPYYSGVSVPSNVSGYQHAASGNAYMGFYTYFPTSPQQNRESIGCQLTTTLIIGTKYYVSFKTSLCSIDSALEFNCATDHLGALFSKVPYSFTNPTPVNNYAQVYGSTIITDTLNWTRITGSFIADSAYKYLYIGNFFDDITTNKSLYFTSETVHAAYYFWDDVCVSTDSIYAANYNYILTGIEHSNNTKQKFNIYPNPSGNGIFYTPTAFINQQIEVFDVMGRSINKLQVTGNTIDLSYLETGMYFIQFNNQSRSKQKLIINK